MVATTVVAKAAASLATGLLGFASLRNMVETQSIVRSHHTAVCATRSSTSCNIATTLHGIHSPKSKNASRRRKRRILDEYISVNPTTEGEGKYSISIPNSKTDEEIINDLKQMSRKDLMTLFLCCNIDYHQEHEDDVLLDEIRGDWDGILLNNNFILTSVSNFITNQLFGINHNGPWCGKTFGRKEHTDLDDDAQDEMLATASSSSSSLSSSVTKRMGVNRFYHDQDQKWSDKIHSKDSTNTATTARRNIIRKQHPFQYSISKSKLNKSQGIILDYSPYQSFWSPWKTMKDEVRILCFRRPSSHAGSPETITATATDTATGTSQSLSTRGVTSKHEISILLGVGSMAWSGGFLNCQPFCLTRARLNSDAMTKRGYE